jgi:HSP20 family molecular chaperone IbpA
VNPIESTQFDRPQKGNRPAGRGRRHDFCEGRLRQAATKPSKAAPRRVIAVPFGPDPKTVNTYFAKGVLKIPLPKSTARKHQTVKISVKATA